MDPPGAAAGTAGQPGTTAQVSGNVLMATAGATGQERVSVGDVKKRRHRHHRRSSSAGDTKTTAKSSKRSKSATHHHHRQHRSRSSGASSGGTTKATNLVVVPAAPPVFDDAPLLLEDNMAGYVDRKARTVLGVETRMVKTVMPTNQTKLTHESFIKFSVRSSADEHIRFRRDSLTLMFYATYKNQTAGAGPEADQTREATADRWALRARDNKLFMWLDPSVGATSFFSHVDVSIDNVPVNSSSLMGNLWLQYTRACQIFSNKDNVRLRSGTDLAIENIAKAEYKALREATDPFHYGAWNTTTGRRIEANLRGVFPFDFKNEGAASADNLKEPNYYFPPNTHFDFRFHFHPDKLAAVFHPEVAGNMTEYFNARGTAATGYGVADLEKYALRYTIAGAFLEYDTVVLRPEQKLDYLHRMKSGTPATYRYDVVRGQKVPIPSGQAYVDLAFTVSPYARLMYMLFLPDWATMIMPSYRRPLSGLSQFPSKCTKLSLLFAGQKTLVTPSFERPGFLGEQHHSTQRILYHYLQSHHVWSGDFAELFPAATNAEPFNQMLFVDLRESMSERSESLNLRMEFAEADKSPPNLQAVLLTVHSTGEVTCVHAGGQGHYDWRWESKY